MTYYEDAEHAFTCLTVIDHTRLVLIECEAPPPFDDEFYPEQFSECLMRHDFHMNYHEYGSP